MLMPMISQLEYLCSNNQLFKLTVTTPDLACDLTVGHTASGLGVCSRGDVTELCSVRRAAAAYVALKGRAMAD
jgi:hypothetical protein